MEAVGIWQILIVLVAGVLPVVCFWRILPRAGISAWVALVAVIPLGTFVLLAVLAFTRWPEDTRI